MPRATTPNAIFVCCGVGAGSFGKRHAKSCDPVDRVPVLPRTTPILSAKGRKHIAMQALRRHATKWLTEQGWKVRVMGVPVLAPTGREDVVKYRVELLFIGDPT